jgi:hypothetical protein
MSTVKLFFYPLYDEDAAFRDFLVSVGNKDSKTKNRTIDRYKAIEMMVERAREAHDTVLPAAMPGEVLQCLTTIMRQEGLGLRARLAQQRQLTAEATAAAAQTAAAEAMAAAEATADAE